MTEPVQLHIFQLFYTFFQKRLVLMGKTTHFFYRLNVYHHVCCLLSNLKCVLRGSKLCRLHVWLWWLPQGWRRGGWLSACGGASGTCPAGGSSLSDVLHPFALSFRMCWGWLLGLAFVFGFFLLSVLSTHSVFFFFFY